MHGGTILKLIEQAGAVVSARHCNSGSDSGKTPGPLITALARVEHMDFYDAEVGGDSVQLEEGVNEDKGNALCV